MNERHKVSVERLVITGPDSWGNQGETYASPATVRVFGWSAPTSFEPNSGAGDNRVATVLELLCAEGVQLNAGDKVTLPYAPAGTFKVRGRAHEYSASPFSGWRPGKVVELVEVTG